MDPSPEFFSWLANQPAFVEVAVGVFFCLVVAPALLAGIATAITLLEGFVETGLSAIPMLNMAPACTRSSGTSRWHSGVAELVSRLTGFGVKRQQKLLTDDHAASPHGLPIPRGTPAAPAGR
jgi:hypothetical protein